MYACFNCYDERVFLFRGGGGGGLLGKVLGYMVAFLKGSNLSDVTWDLT